MKQLQTILLLIIIQFSNAQDYKKINFSKISYKRNGLFTNNAIVITDTNNSKLPKGFYEIEGKGIEFYISEKGNIDGLFKEYLSNGLLATKTTLKEGALQSVVNLDSIGKTTDSLQISKKDIERYDKATKNWKTENILVYSNYIFNKKGDVLSVSYGLEEEDIKTIRYNENGKILSDETKFYYKKEYDSLGILTHVINYNWKTKEKEILSYGNGKLNQKTIIFDKNKIWNSDGIITEKAETNNSIPNSNTIETGFFIDDETSIFYSIPKNRGYKIVTGYYPNGQIKFSKSKDGIFKEYTEKGVLIEDKHTETIMMSPKEQHNK